MTEKQNKMINFFPNECVNFNVWPGIWEWQYNS